jgi:hypothetical protein
MPEFMDEDQKAKDQDPDQDIENCHTIRYLSSFINERVKKRKSCFVRRE